MDEFELMMHLHRNNKRQGQVRRVHKPSDYTG
jgi:hypothetical protein